MHLMVYIFDYKSCKHKFIDNSVFFYFILYLYINIYDE